MTAKPARRLEDLIALGAKIRLKKKDSGTLVPVKRNLACQSHPRHIPSYVGIPKSNISFRRTRKKGGEKMVIITTT